MKKIEVPTNFKRGDKVFVVREVTRADRTERLRVGEIATISSVNNNENPEMVWVEEYGIGPIPCRNHVPFVHARFGAVGLCTTINEMIDELHVRDHLLGLYRDYCKWHLPTVSDERDLWAKIKDVEAKL